MGLHAYFLRDRRVSLLNFIVISGLYTESEGFLWHPMGYSGIDGSVCIGYGALDQAF